MLGNIVNVGLAFIEGVALIASPCILPILPIILSGSLTGSRKRPFGIISGFVVSFALITLFSRVVLDVTHIDHDLVRNMSYGLLLIVGLMMLSTYLLERFNRLTQRLLGLGSSISLLNNAESGFLGGFLFGGLVGLIWTPCAGPILAAVMVQVILQKSTTGSLLAILAFAIGAGVPMLLIALFGRSMMKHVEFLRAHASALRKCLGLVIVVSVFLMIKDPTFGLSQNRFCLLTPSSKLVTTKLIDEVPIPYRAPVISGIVEWINSSPIDISDLTGKVVLVDFWTYSCINCIRTLPHLNDWYAKYHDKGLVIIGVHSPEFEFEKSSENVKRAVALYGIKYPVAMDNAFTTWQNYQNQYWPAEYLIDKNGNIVTEKFGETDYAVTENNIRFLLGLTGPAVINEKDCTQQEKQTPETYLGYERSQHFASEEAVRKNQPNVFSFPPTLLVDQWALKGTWMVYPDKVVSVTGSGDAIRLHFTARKVFAVMGVAYQVVKIHILIDGNEAPNSPMEISGHQLYTLYDGAAFGDGNIEIVAENPGLEVYTFTFGS